LRFERLPVDEDRISGLLGDDMTSGPICVEEIPRWVPGEVLLSSDRIPLQGVKLRCYRYQPDDIEVPALQDFMFIAYRRGLAVMERLFKGRWRQERLVPGDVSLQTRNLPTHWNWDGGLEVIHVHLTMPFVAQVCEEVFDRQVAEVHFRDVLKTPDPILFQGATAIAEEVANPGPGGPFYIDAVARQMCVHTLRKYSIVSFREKTRTKGLSPRRARQVADYIEANLEQALTLEELAREMHLSGYHLLRQFKLCFDVAPHRYVINRRLERAKELLAKGDLPIKEIAMRVGFSDQPHMTRVFRRFLKTTPSAYRTVVRG
jgi:AraC family transcriptional regulator